MHCQPETSRPHDRSNVPGPGRRITAALLALSLLLGWSTAPAGTSGGPATPLGQSGSGAPLVQGDYVSALAGLDTYFSYFIEVPPGTLSLVIDIFDPNVGGLHDLVIGANDTATGYQVLDPTGSSVGLPNFTLPAGAGPDNVWAMLLTAANPMPGHWELRIDTSSAITPGNDVQAYGVRAHDGDCGGRGP